MNILDEKILELKYDENEILLSKEMGLDSFKPFEEKRENNKYIVIERTEKDLSSNNYDIGIVESVVDRAFPGSLIKANSKLLDNNPDILVANRKPMRFRIDLPGMEKEAEFTVDSPDYINVSSAIEQRVNVWNDKYASKNKIAARTVYKESMIYSKQQMNAKFGFDINKLDKELGIDFEAIYKNDTSVFISELQQIFYTVSSEMPKNPSDTFDDNQSWDDLVKKGVDKKNPPALVNKVAYGRKIYVKLETNSKDTSVKAAFKAAMSGASTDLDMKYKEILKNTNFTVIVLGGGAKEHISVVKCNNLEKVKEIIEQNSEYSRKNPGYPIFYNTIFLKDNVNAKVINMVKYVETTSKEYSGGTIALIHEGAYVAQFRVSWDEISYDDNGNKIVTRKNWSGNSQDRTARFSTEIYLEGNCENIHIFARECTGLAWEWWRTVFDKGNLPLIPKRTCKIGGTTLHPKYSMEEK